MFIPSDEATNREISGIYAVTQTLMLTLSLLHPRR